MMGDSEAKLKWKKENTRNLVININKNTDAEIFAWLDGLGKSYGAEIKKAIKANKNTAHVGNHMGCISTLVG